MAIKDAIRAWLGVDGNGHKSVLPGDVWSVTSGRTSTREFLQSYEDIGWLNATVGKIALSVADAKWRLYRGNDKQKRTEVTSHPILTLLNYINPFDTSQEFMELHQIYMELSGKAFWALNRNKLGIPVEVWLLPPHQVKVIPSQKNFIEGFEYSSGSFKRRFPFRDVVFFKNARPLNQWDGLSPFKAVAVDLDAEEFAGKWNRAFFKNSARTDAVIEVDGQMSDESYERLKREWQSHYGGTAKAHKLAILESGAHYKPTSMTQKDMDFVAGRKQSKENILGVVGMPLPVMGITENVNRANAEAGAYIFCRWVIKPRLDKLKNKVNQKLLPQFPGTEGLYLDYDEIVEETMEARKGIAETGIKWAMLTINEGRRLMGFDDIGEDGEKRLIPLSYIELGAGESVPIPSGSEPIVEGFKGKTFPNADVLWQRYALKAERQEPRFISELAKLWNDQEAEVLGKLTGADKPDDVTFNMEKAKTRFGKALRPLMTEVLRGAAEDADVLIRPEPERRAAEEYPISEHARKWLDERSSWLVKGVNGETRDAIAAQLVEGFEAGEGIPDLSKRVKGVFSDCNRRRSKVIARTEVIAASNEGALVGYKDSGVVEKVEFFTALDERTCEECMGLHGNQYALDNASGMIPVHPQCRCTWLPIV